MLVGNLDMRACRNFVFHFFPLYFCFCLDGLLEFLIPYEWKRMVELLSLSAFYDFFSYLHEQRLKRTQGQSYFLMLIISF